MLDPIDRLLDEHRTIMAWIGDLRRAAAELRRGEAALPSVRPALEEVSRKMGAELLAHARREDEALFPALEEMFGATGTPTVVLREEHQVIRGRAELFRRTLRELNEVEHPAIVAGGEKLGALAANGGNAGELRATAETIVELLDLHFAKEEGILFPMAREALTPETLREVARKMEELDAS